MIQQTQTNKVKIPSNLVALPFKKKTVTKIEKVQETERISVTEFPFLRKPVTFT